MILRTTANRNCEYQWGVHVAIFAKAAKLTPEQVAATRATGVDAALWTAEAASLIWAIDNLCSTGGMSDTVLARFEADWSPEQQLEILALCGTYHTVSFVANTARLPGEAFGATFPD
ncbi:carboxymuconolactone decarboxylase family protein [Hyphomonas sp.]|uniref:carboxymuconolactone decarboxylase family protein n=1 Tax=Hyphomonas sp. TaxID=87 RepID=UPI0039E4E07B